MDVIYIYLIIMGILILGTFLTIFVIKEKHEYDALYIIAFSTLIIGAVLAYFGFFKNTYFNFSDNLKSFIGNLSTEIIGVGATIWLVMIPLNQRAKKQEKQIEKLSQKVDYMSGDVISLEELRKITKISKDNIKKAGLK